MVEYICYHKQYSGKKLKGRKGGGDEGGIGGRQIRKKSTKSREKLRSTE